MRNWQVRVRSFRPFMQLSIERLESRQLLTGCMTDCQQLSEVFSTLDDAGASSEIEVNSSTSHPLLGPVTDLGMLTSTRSISDVIGSGDTIDAYAFATGSTTEVDIELVGGANTTLYLVERESFGRRPGFQSSDGVIATPLDAGEYYLIVIDFSSFSSPYEIQISVPEPLVEFPEIPYVGRDFDWNLNSVNAPEVWEQGFTGDGALVAVVDTGVDYTHPDLDANIWTNPGEIAGDGIDNDRNGFIDDVHGWDFAYGDNDPMDVNGHGTHVAGTIAAERNGVGTTGVAYAAEILPVKVLRDGGSGSFSAIASGIRYAVDVGADVINLSLGGGFTRSIQFALQYAWQNDVLVVAASGNDAANRPGSPAILSSIYPNTLSVGAHDRDGIRSVFSNGVGNSGSIQVDAPGTRIASTYPNASYRYLNGTSMAAPHVAGVAALAISANNRLSSTDLRDLLVDGANRSTARSDSIGGINASRTVARAFRFDEFQRIDDNQVASAEVADVTAIGRLAIANSVRRRLPTKAEFSALLQSLDENENRSVGSIERRGLPVARTATRERADLRDARETQVDSAFQDADEDWLVGLS